MLANIPVQSYDFATSLWTNHTLNDTIITGAYVNGKVVLLTANGTTYYLYNATSGAYTSQTKSTSLVSPLGRIGAYVGNIAVFAGGCSSTYSFVNNEYYDTTKKSNKAWTSTGSGPRVCTGLSSTTFGNSAYFAGGCLGPPSKCVPTRVACT